MPLKTMTTAILARLVTSQVVTLKWFSAPNTYSPRWAKTTLVISVLISLVCFLVICSHARSRAIFHLFSMAGLNPERLAANRAIDRFAVILFALSRAKPACFLAARVKLVFLLTMLARGRFLFRGLGQSHALAAAVFRRFCPPLPHQKDTLTKCTY